MYPKIIAIDYDGTLALNSYPQAGDPNWPVIEAAKIEKAGGSQLILWTCREGEELDVAIEACREWGLEFDAVNDNLPRMKEAWGNNPRKIFANEYWDDRAMTLPVLEEMWGKFCDRFVHCGDCPLGEYNWGDKNPYDNCLGWCKEHPAMLKEVMG